MAKEEEKTLLDFSYFDSEDCKISTTGETKPASTNSEIQPIKKRAKKSTDNPTVVVDNSMNVQDVNYARTYDEGTSLIRGAIAQADALSAEIKDDIESVRSSKTLKNKYTYITNLTASASSLLSAKINAIKELNGTVTQIHNLELNRLKALKLDADKEKNDDARMMDLYSAFVNAPVGTYNPNQPPSFQDITVGANSPTSGIVSVEMAGNELPAYGGPTLTPEQNRMRMESNPNIKTVVRYDQNTGRRSFDVIDTITGGTVPNYPRPEPFLLDDTIIDVTSGIARNRNINTVWPLVLEGNTGAISEY